MVERAPDGGRGRVAQVARRYADFVLVRPFYEFSFLKSLIGMWQETPLLGRHAVRKMERRLFLSFDYAVEAFYCELIQLATRSAYGVAGSETYAWIENAGDSVFVLNPRIRRVQSVGRGSDLVIIPRYQEFTSTVMRLVARRVRFSEIAGNDDIMLSALTQTRSRTTWRRGGCCSPPRCSQPGRASGRAVTGAVAARVLIALRAGGHEVEHITRLQCRIDTVLDNTARSTPNHEVTRRRLTSPHRTVALATEQSRGGTWHSAGPAFVPVAHLLKAGTDDGRNALGNAAGGLQRAQALV